MSIRVLQGDCREVLATLPDESVHCVVTSPPYWGLRDYGTPGQLGLEPTYQGYVAAMVAVFREVRRVLRKDGTLWLNLGDSYAGGGRGGNPEESPHRKQATNTGSVTGITKNPWPVPNGLKPKDLVGIPWRVAFALQDDGWYLRQDIIWSKPNPMPESVTDRCTKAHEYLFLLTKSARYFYDAEAIAEQASEWSQKALTSDWVRRSDYGTKEVSGRNAVGESYADRVRSDGKRNKRSVWTVATQPYSEAHFATFPPALIEPCILAGCPHKCCAKCGAPWVRKVERISEESGREARGKALSSPRNDGSTWNENGGRGFMPVTATTLGFSCSCSCDVGTLPGTVLDLFGGAGTTGLVADRLQRNAILIELNLTYAAMARDRIVGDAPLFAQAAE